MTLADEHGRRQGSPARTAAATRIKLSRELVVRLSRALASTAQAAQATCKAQQTATMASAHCIAPGPQQCHKLQSAPAAQPPPPPPPPSLLAERDPSARNRMESSGGGGAQRDDCSIQSAAPTKRCAPAFASWAPKGSRCDQSSHRICGCCCLQAKSHDKFASDQCAPPNCSRAPTGARANKGAPSGNHARDEQASRGPLVEARTEGAKSTTTRPFNSDDDDACLPSWRRAKLSEENLQQRRQRKQKQLSSGGGGDNKVVKNFSLVCAQFSQEPNKVQATSIGSKELLAYVAGAHNAERSPKSQHGKQELQFKRAPLHRQEAEKNVQASGPKCNAHTRGRGRRHGRASRGETTVCAERASKMSGANEARLEPPQRTQQTLGNVAKRRNAKLNLFNEKTNEINRNKSTVIRSSSSKKASKQNGSQTRSLKRAKRARPIKLAGGDLHAPERCNKQQAASKREAQGAPLVRLLLFLTHYLLFKFTFVFCDTQPEAAQAKKSVGANAPNRTKRAIVGLALLIASCSLSHLKEQPAIQFASAAQVGPLKAPPSAPTTGGGGELVETARTAQELKSAVMATMLATQSTLSELNSSLTRPHFLAQTAGSLAPELGGGGGDGELPESATLSPMEVALDSIGGRARAASPEEEGALAESAGYEQQQQSNATAGNQQNGQQPPAADYLESALDFCRIFIMGAIIVGDICGNSLVILSVCRHSKLRVTTNWFVVSLACADILVALFAMTFNASVIIWGRWLFKPWVCDFWNSCDVLASTASILHLCCISIDRYIAIMRPLDYPMKITTRRVVYALCAVWISSALLSYIPIFTGVYTTSEHIQWLKENPDQCEFVVNRVYAIVSSSISFWIPCCIMVFTYYRIYREATRQEKFIYKAQSMMPAPMLNHHNHSQAKQRRSKSMAATMGSAPGITRLASGANERIKSPAGRANQPAGQSNNNSSSHKAEVVTTELSAAPASSMPQVNAAPENEPLTGSAVDVNNNTSCGTAVCSVAGKQPLVASSAVVVAGAQQRASSQSKGKQQQQQQDEEDDDRDSNSGQSTPTKRSISKMKREHKAAKTLGIIMGVFILCWLPFFSWYTPQNMCGKACDGMLPRSAVTLLFWIGYFNSTLNPIIYAYFNHEFRDAFKKTLQWIFCCCQDLKCLRVNRPNDNQHYNCTYRSTQEIGLVTNG